MVNSNHDVGRVWIGAKDPKGRPPVEIYVNHKRTAQDHTPSILLYRCPLGFAVRGGVGRSVLLSGYDL